MRVYAATANEGKLRELRAIFGALCGWDVVAFDGYEAPPEGESSYADNAALKARALAQELRAAGIDGAVVGDDSGLEVEALGGRPGVLSARYGGAAASWTERRRLLIAEVDASGSAERRARFVCAMHLVLPDGREVTSEASIEGRLASEARGEGGFSYDAIFEYSPDRRTFAERSATEKNALSHRAQAAQRLVAAVTACEAVRSPEKKRRACGM
jgi:XTP/dITP diphosphohydrolase